MHRACNSVGALFMAASLMVAMRAAALAPLVNATLQPSQIVMGQSAELTITTSGSDSEALSLPAVEGLDFRIIGQSHRVEIVNGATLVSTALVVRVTPKAVGIYTIPGVTPKTQPLVLRVNTDDGTSSPLGSLGSNHPAPAGGRADAIRMNADGSAFVRMVLPKHEMVVGESIPVDIEVGMRDGFVSSLNGLPTLTGGGDFTLNNLSHQPDRNQKLIDGKGFTLLTWHSVLAGVKPGKYSLSLQTPLTIRVQMRPQRESKLEDLLGDPFMQNFFGVTVPKDITISSPPAQLTVSALPAEGRPPEFGGAVGSFKIASELSAPTAAAGDPVTLRMRVTGTGNFDRVDSPMLDHVDAWKTYPPKSSFKASDALGYKGEKVFEQPLIAAQPGAQTLPGLSFSYFDPATHHYETVHSAPLTVTITASAADNSLRAPQTASAPAAPGVGTGVNPPAAATAGLRDDHAASAQNRASLIPPYLQPRFLAIPSLLSLALAGGWLARRRASSDRRPLRRSRREALAAQRALKDLDAAAQAGDAVRFFNAARTSLLPAVGAHLETESEAIRQIFALADEANYSADPLTATDFARWSQNVRRRLEEPST